MEATKKHRFEVGQMIYVRTYEECYTISQLMFVNGHPCYYVNEVRYLFHDLDCSVPPTFNF